MSMEVMEVECVKEEPDWESSVSKHEVLEDLYVGHKVKHELVLGPELLQRVQHPLAPHAIEVTVKIEEREMRDHEEEIIKYKTKADEFANNSADANPHCLSRRDLFTLQDCFVQIERMTLHKEQYTCKTCGKTYSQKFSLTKHMHNHGEKKSIAKKDVSKSTKNNAIKETTARVKYSCIKKYGVDKPYKCRICDKQFKLKALLTNHERIHTGEKPYSCKICNRGFTEKSNLKRHERIHTGEKPFSCEICKKQFSLKVNLMGHIRVHTKERPYSCILCGKKFPDLSGLNRHKLIHSEYKKFKCDVCGKRFARRHHIIEHIRTHNKKQSNNNKSM